jgi:hypothetical protein
VTSVTAFNHCGDRFPRRGLQTRKRTPDGRVRFPEGAVWTVPGEWASFPGHEALGDHARHETYEIHELGE